MRLWAYIKEDARRSFAAWEQGEAMSTLLTLVITFIISATTVLAREADWTRLLDSWDGHIGQAVLVWFVLLVLVVTPYRMWSSERSKVEAFTEQAIPRIRINGPKVLTHPKDSDGPAVRTVRVEIENLSSSVIHNCRVREDDFENWMGQHSGQNRAFRQAEDFLANQTDFDFEQFFDLRAKERQIIEIARLVETSPDSGVEMRYALRRGAPTWDALNRRLFPHELLLAVYADELVEPVRARFLIYIMSGLLRMERLA